MGSSIKVLLDVFAITVGIFPAVIGLSLFILMRERKKQETKMLGKVIYFFVYKMYVAVFVTQL